MREGHLITDGINRVLSVKTSSVHSNKKIYIKIALKHIRYTYIFYLYTSIESICPITYSMNLIYLYVVPSQSKYLVNFSI
jgi:hypothetical protein